VADLTAWAASRHLIDPRALWEFDNFYGYNSVASYVLSGHRDFGTTTCPGGNLYAELPNLRGTAWDRLPDYDVRFGTLDIPEQLLVDQTVTVYPNLFNAGRTTWRDVDGVRLGYRWLRDGEVVSENTAAALLTADVGFGGMTALVGRLTAPSLPGSYALRWDMYRDGVGWFAQQPAPAGRSQPLDLPVQIYEPTPEPTPTPHLPGVQAWLQPPFVHAGDAVTYQLSVEGPNGLDFGTLTHLPQGLVYLPDGGAKVQLSEIRWLGVLGEAVMQASFPLSVGSALSIPAALPLTTTLDVSGFPSLQINTPLIVNGHLSFLALASRQQPPTPTPTATPTPTPSPTPIPSPTPSPTPALNCWNLVVNGGFEGRDGWTINDTPYPASYSTEQHRDGAWSMRLGIPPGGENTYSYSSIDQSVSIPADAESVTWSYWRYPLSSDLTGDWFDVLIHDGTRWHWLTELRGDAQSWQQGSHDLSVYAGHELILRLRVFNNGTGGQTAVWLDDVSLRVCTP
jgi:hypothetical protein